MSKNLKIFRMVTREDVLAEVLEDGASTYKLKNPVRVMIIPMSPQLQAANQNPQVGFAPWADFTADTEFVVKKEHVIFVSDPIKEFVAQYQNMFSPILTPQTKLITP